MRSCATAQQHRERCPDPLLASYLVRLTVNGSWSLHGGNDLTMRCPWIVPSARVSLTKWPSIEKF
jgi:hypothetical protein